MTTILAIEIFVCINLIVIGASHLFQPGIWISFFEYLHKLGHPGNIFNALLALGTGSIVLSFHFVWQWPGILVTLYGALLTLKGALYLISPQTGLNSIAKVNASSKGKLRFVGGAMMILGIILMGYLVIILTN